jgi:hypothetical protein
MRFAHRVEIFLFASLLIFVTPFAPLAQYTASNSPSLSKWDSRYDLSGIAQIGTNRFAVVHDSKVDFHPADRPRIGVLVPSPHGVTYAPFRIDWSNGNLPNDLEAIYPVPGRTNEYLIAESGYYQTNRFGRVYRIRLDANELTGTVLQTWHWPKGTENIEGIALDSTARLLFAAQRDGFLHVAPIALGENPSQLIFSTTQKVESSFPADWRPLSDICLIEGTLFAVGAFEPEEVGPATGMGPFDSAVYSLAKVQPSGKIHFLTASNQNPIPVHGFKIEALCATDLPNKPFAISTDDEGLGGVWRLLSRGKNSQDN